MTVTIIAYNMASLSSAKSGRGAVGWGWHVRRRVGSPGRPSPRSVREGVCVTVQDSSCDPAMPRFYQHQAGCCSLIFWISPKFAIESRHAAQPPSRSATHATIGEGGIGDRHPQGCTRSLPEPTPRAQPFPSCSFVSLRCLVMTRRVGVAERNAQALSGPPVARKNSCALNCDVLCSF